jgi:hypothetical protein
MRNVLALIGALVVGFGGIGWYLGWYKLNVSKAPDGEPQITTTVDTKKVVTDTENGAKQVGSFVGDHLEKSAEDAKQPGPPAGTPGPATTPQTNPAPQPAADPNGSIFVPTPPLPPPAVPMPEQKKGIPLIAPMPPKN